MIGQTIFLSHASEDLEYARLLKLNMQIVGTPMRSVFLSSDIGGIRTDLPPIFSPGIMRLSPVFVRPIRLC